MFEEFDAAELGYVVGPRVSGNAAQSILKKADFDAAIAEITGWDGYMPTPLHHLQALASELHIFDILYKDEGSRFGLRSFKALGGAYAGMRVLQRELSRRLGRDIQLDDIRDGSLRSEIGKITLTSATDGNHGRSLAWGAQTVGAPCRIYVHKEVSDARIRAMRDLGADVIVVDGDYDHSVHVTREVSEANGWLVVSDTSWDGYTQVPTDVMAGYGVMAEEACASLSIAPTHLFIQGGVGGLAASVTARLRQRMGDATRVVVVEPELAACLFVSGKTGEATNVPILAETLMAGLSCGEPSGVAWQILREEVGDFMTIPENLVGPTMRLLARPLGDDPAIEAGESAVCGLAALIAAARQPELRGKLGLDGNSRVLVIGSEGATDAELYAEIMRVA